MSEQPNPTILVIIGITGDLSRRYILPAIEEIAQAGAAPDRLRIIGITRRAVATNDLLPQIMTPGPHDFLAKNLEMYQMNLARQAEYDQLKQYLDHLKNQFAFDLAPDLAPDAQVVFYLSVPPQVSQPIIACLGESGLAESSKLLLEKPFGTDLACAEELISQTKRYFSEEQIYRVDHYLAKEMAQNLIVFRECNSLFKRTWSKEFIQAIKIIVSEKIGIEGRAAFYEQTGALRDFQSHLLQLAALILMKTPDITGQDEVPQRRLEALRQLHLPTDKPLPEYAKRGQYQGYRDEVGNPDSTIETFIDLTLASTDPNWTGVPIRLITGKALSERTTEICITYKPDHTYEPNQLRIIIQPEAGIQLDLWTKTPGYQRRTEKHSLGLVYKHHFAKLPQAYEQVFVDAINGNHTLFTSSDEVLETWRILDPIQKAWEMSAQDMQFYLPGRSIDDSK